MRQKAKYLLILLLIILISVTIHSYYYFWLKPISLLKNNTTTYDAIIVPGVPFDKQGWSTFMKWRVHWGVYLYKNNIAKNIIFSGSAVHTPWIEAEIMKLYAIELGVDSNHIFIENKALHSTENIYYSNLIAIDNNFKKIAIATDPFQSYRLESFTKKVNENIEFIPIVYSILNNQELINPIINPNKAFINDFIPLSEKESFIERFKGSMGENVDLK